MKVSGETSLKKKCGNIYKKVTENRLSVGKIVVLFLFYVLFDYNQIVLVNLFGLGAYAQLHSTYLVQQ